MAVHATTRMPYTYMGCDGCLGFAPGPNRGHFMGAIDTAGYDAGEAAGIPDSVLSYLDDIGATDNDVTYLAAGEQTLTETLANYGATVSSMPAQAQLDAANAGLIPAITSTSAQQAASTAASVSSGATTVATAASTAQSKPGTILSATISFPGLASLGTNLTASASGLISALQSALPTYGMSIQNSSSSTGVLSNTSVSITILDSIGHNLISDVESVLFSLSQSYLGTAPTVSLSIISSPTGATGSGATVTSAATVSSTSLTTWFENNAGLLAIGAGALILGSILLNRR